MRSSKGQRRTTSYQCVGPIVQFQCSHSQDCSIDLHMSLPNQMIDGRRCSNDAIKCLQLSNMVCATSWAASVLRTGFLKLVQGALRIVEDGACHGGPPCSSWIWLNKGTSKRSMRCVMGDLKQRTVLQSNAILECILVPKSTLVLAQNINMDW